MSPSPSLPKAIMKLRIPRHFRFNSFNLRSLVFLGLLSLFWIWTSTSFLDHVGLRSPPLKPITEHEIQKNTRIARQFMKVPVPEYEFGEMGRRVQTLTRWLMQIDMEGGSVDANALSEYESLVEQTIVSLFPFIQSGNDWSHKSPRSFAKLRRSFIPGSRGIVIPTGINTFRYTCHLILNLRSVLKSSLPIQIIHAGDLDLPLVYRSALLSLFSSLNLADIEFLDITNVFDDTTLKLSDGMSKWAIKPFALLASTFEEVILIDSDAIFLQPPEVILDTHSGYLKTGTLFFHDRLIGKDAYRYRHEFWRWEMKGHRPSSTFKKSRVMRENYGQEQDSGVVILNKGNLGVLMGLLHACWQNTYVVRELITYQNTHGDKETYWMGMELSGVEYAFAEHYGGIIGERVRNETVWPVRFDVCGSVIAHVDEAGRLLWFNGGLVRRKNNWEGMRAFMEVRGEGVGLWALDGKWRWNYAGNRWNMACMEGGTVKGLSVSERGIIGGSVEEAREVDGKYAKLMGLMEPKVIENGEEYEGFENGTVRVEMDGMDSRGT